MPEKEFGEIDKFLREKGFTPDGCTGKYTRKSGITLEVIDTWMWSCWLLVGQEKRVGTPVLNGLMMSAYSMKDKCQSCLHEYEAKGKEVCDCMKHKTGGERFTCPDCGQVWVLAHVGPGPYYERLEVSPNAP